MSPELWDHVERILVEALKRPRRERTEFLDRACGGREELRREVESLLTCAEPQVEPTDAPFEPLSQPPPQVERGSHLGPYRVLEEIGSGGMGRVFLALHPGMQPPTPVAIKLLRLGLDETLARRFVREMRVLSRLDHPNVVRILDSGTAGNGLPYFVMEYVDGQPIEDHCSHRGLGAYERVRLFIKVCATVHFLHQKSVLHRDLKPGNVLVDASGEPKLLDFGIAKTLTPERVGGAAFDTDTFSPMTVRFASPEQVSGQPTTTATDVYGLGVLLYRLLTGEHPYELSRSLLAQLTQICREEPRKPSQATSADWRAQCATSTLDPASPPSAPEEDRERASLRRSLTEELDRIVLKALAKNPRDRFASANALAEALDQHLSSLPVELKRHFFPFPA